MRQMEANDLEHPLFRVLSFRRGQRVIAGPALGLGLGLGRTRPGSVGDGSTRTCCNKGPAR
jgi:hypothetical protein